MCGAIVTSPFDVVKTRLQSDLFRAKHHIAVEGNGVAAVAVRRNLLWHFVETAHIIRYVFVVGTHIVPRQAAEAGR